LNENKPQVDGGVQRRRRVLRGAISAPVVLTISSGASATMASNMRCVANQVTNPQNGTRSTAVSTALTSTTVRVPLYRTGDGKRYIRGSDIVSLAHASRPVTWIKTGEWWEFNVNSNRRVGSAVMLATTPPLTSPVQYVVLQMNSQGQIVSAGVHTGSTAMVHGTCWNSFRSGALPPL
jgi:hypothetical protein